MLQRFVDPAAAAEEVERVRSLSGYALRRHWQAVFGRSAPKHLTAELRRRMIAMRIQEEAFGTLDTAALKALDKLAGRNCSKVENSALLGFAGPIAIGFDGAHVFALEALADGCPHEP